MQNLIWTEKYRPTKYEDVKGIIPEEIYKLEKNLPHILLEGPAGIGKTTLMKIIAQRIGSDVLLLNSSDERKIETVRDKIKMFAMTKSTKGENKLKLVLLDEFDGMLPLAQQALRNIMETYSSNCRFILTCNYGARVIEPIKSRCIRITFDKITNEMILNRLKYICNCEKLQISDEILLLIIDKMNGDIRKCINKLQELSSLQRTITKNDIKKEELLLDDLFNLLKQKKFTEARKFLLDNNVDYDSLVLGLHQWIYKSDLTSQQKIQSILNLCEVAKYLNVVISKELLFAEFLIKEISILK